MGDVFHVKHEDSLLAWCLLSGALLVPCVVASGADSGETGRATLLLRLSGACRSLVGAGTKSPDRSPLRPGSCVLGRVGAELPGTCKSTSGWVLARLSCQCACFSGLGDARGVVGPTGPTSARPPLAGAHCSSTNAGIRTPRNTHQRSKWSARASASARLWPGQAGVPAPSRLRGPAVGRGSRAVDVHTSRPKSPRVTELGARTRCQAFRRHAISSRGRGHRAQPSGARTHSPIHVQTPEAQHHRPTPRRRPTDSAAIRPAEAASHLHGNDRFRQTPHPAHDQLAGNDHPHKQRPYTS